MIEVRTPNGSFSLPLEALQLEQNNELIEVDGQLTPGTYSFGFTVAASNDVLIALQFLNLPQVRDKIRVVDCEIYLYGGRELVGKLTVKRASDKRFECNFIGNGFKIDALEKSLKEVDYGPDVHLGDNTDDILDTLNATIYKSYYGDASGITTADGRELMYQLPTINAENFYGDATDPNRPNPEYCGIVNNYDSGYTRNDFHSGEYVNNYTMVPQLYVNFIFERIFKTLGYTVTGSFFQQFNKTLLYNNYALDKKRNIDYYVNAGTGSVKQFTVVEVTSILDEPDATQLLSSAVVDLVAAIDTYNVFNSTLNTYSPNVSDRYSCRWRVTLGFDSPELGANLGIYIFVEDVFGTIINMYNRTDLQADDFNPSALTFTNTFEFDGVAAGGYKLKILIVTDDSWSDPDARYTATIEYRALTFPELNIYATDIKLANHVPDMKITEFLQEWRKRYNLRFGFSIFSKSVSIDFGIDTFANQPANQIDITNFAEDNFDTEFGEYSPRNFITDFGNEPLANSITNLSDYPGITHYTLYSELPTPDDGQLGNVFYVIATNQVYKCVYLSFFGGSYAWLPIADVYGPYKNPAFDGATYKDWQMKLAPVLTRLVSKSNYAVNCYGLFPATGEPGSSAEYSTVNEFGLKIFNWYGIQDNKPFASSTPYGPDGVTVLQVNHTDYMCYIPVPFFAETFYLFWRQWEEMEASSETLFIRLNLPYDMWKNLDFSQQYLIRNTRYLIKRLRPQFNDGGLMPIDAELVKL